MGAEKNWLYLSGPRVVGCWGKSSNWPRWTHDDQMISYLFTVCPQPTNVFLFQGRHMICFSFSPLSYIPLSYKLHLQILTQKYNKTWSCIGTAASEIGAGVFQERKATRHTGEAQGREGFGSSIVIYVHSIAVSSLGNCPKQASVWILARGLHSKLKMVIYSKFLKLFTFSRASIWF